MAHVNHSITGEHMVAETYQCAKTNSVEYGWTFKVKNASGNVADDTAFDLVLGELKTAAQVNQDWLNTEWAARAIVNAAPQR